MRRLTALLAFAATAAFLTSGASAAGKLPSLQVTSVDVTSGFATVHVSRSFVSADQPWARVTCDYSGVGLGGVTAGGAAEVIWDTSLSGHVTLATSFPGAACGTYATWRPWVRNQSAIDSNIVYFTAG